MISTDIFRFATPADVPTIAALVESAYRGDASRVGWTTEADFLHGRRTDAAEIEELMAKANARFLLLERNGTVVASCYIEKQGSACYFGMFSVHPPCRARASVASCWRRWNASRGTNGDAVAWK